MKRPTIQATDGVTSVSVRCGVFGLVALLMLSGLPASASYWGAVGSNITAKADMAMMDLKFPYFTQPTYYAYSHHSIHSGRDGVTDNLGYYAGTAYNNHGRPDRDRHSFGRRCAP